jgi:hypothetical protein
LWRGIGVADAQGVPYHGRFHPDPADPHHNAPLYLDCCGLVRRAQRDLQSEFGFEIGRYNQSYQFDTLPIRITKEEMRPGDLVFLEAPYHDKSKKPQTHGMALCHGRPPILPRALRCGAPEWIYC